MAKSSPKPSDKEQAVSLLQEIFAEKSFSLEKFATIKKKFTKDNGDLFSKSALLKVFREFAGKKGLPELSEETVSKLRMKPIRTSSGVAPVTVLTKPFPCPGKCIFCPSDIRMPKSYLADEPGAQRAERNYFDPYLQTFNRLTALHDIGHPTSKVEIIVLGGTWSFYPEEYQIWFIRGCFRALNDFGEKISGCDEIIANYEKMEKQLVNALGTDPAKNKQKLKAFELDGAKKSKSYNQTVSELYVGPEKLAGLSQYRSSTWDDLKQEQVRNENSKVRNVGLVIETRPDSISEEEVIRVRRLGCTKTQIGIQSLQDTVLEKNHRGHDVAATREAIKLLRQAGFKIHAHWMANLYGSNPEKDIEEYGQLFSDPDFCPDELKIYPCSLIQSAELMQYYEDGRWQPYTDEELLNVVSHALIHTPEYCRLTRVIRDIPSQDIVVGNMKTNFREIATKHVELKPHEFSDIRSREVRSAVVSREDLVLKTFCYKTNIGQEIFLQFVTKENQIAGFLRLSLPSEKSFIKELENEATIREVHVYGQLVAVGTHQSGKSQHLGLGGELMDAAKDMARDSGYKTLAVISAIGTREYYRKRGFVDGELYQHCEL
ncbi:MAG: histone acetyltransferase [Candidatus Pacebacteria bacterium CG_4_10_14_0_8_um_filter_42_14]|nr:MAG: histone acetyltransferase [Candidatus Pacebacteria bacterium CG_4_10_14_0_8_um_filter_42_14]